MSEIICPHCQTAFKIDETNYADILKQVRDGDFEKQLHERLALAAKDKHSAVELAKAAFSNDLLLAAAVKDSEIQDLKAQLSTFKIEKRLAVTEAVNEVAKERDDFKSSLQLAESKMALAEISLNDKYKTQIKERDDTIKNLLDMKLRLSTKMVGETLELHCENQFNLIRPTAFQRASFDKDNNTNSGSKGDYIFKESDETGIEIVSIMFEMKNESAETEIKKKNEEFFKKLDKDRTDKGCEYAVLVSMLETDSEFYNNGIVDVSYKYPKMYVVRPQFFIPIITLRRNAAMNSLKYKTELALVKSQQIDVTNFEAELDQFKSLFSKHYNLASGHFQKAILEIDKSILHLQRTKDELMATSNSLSHANNRGQEVTVRRLTLNNPTMAKKFDELRSTAPPTDDSISLP